MENKIIVQKKSKKDFSVNCLALLFLGFVLASIGLYFKYIKGDHDLLRLFVFIIYVAWIIEGWVLFVIAYDARGLPNWKKHHRKEAYLVLILLFVSYGLLISSSFFPDCMHKVACIGISFGTMICSILFLGIFIEGVLRARKKESK